MRTANAVISYIKKLATLSFQEGYFPYSFKTALITPLIKKPNLDSSNLSNYRPISNLNNISKILEKLFLTHFQSHILASPNFNPHQSAYRCNHSTETALLCTLDHVFHSADSKKSTIIVSLDLSAAFGTIDHSILLNRLQTSFGISGMAIQWITSYLTDRSHYVKLDTFFHNSNLVNLACLKGPYSSLSSSPSMYHQLLLCSLTWV
jgi:Reverse transcriptase (RNA-dependent DNA polymerase)